MVIKIRGMQLLRSPVFSKAEKIYMDNNIMPMVGDVVEEDNKDQKYWAITHRYVHQNGELSFYAKKPIWT